MEAIIKQLLQDQEIYRAPEGLRSSFSKSMLVKLYYFFNHQLAAVITDPHEQQDFIHALKTASAQFIELDTELRLAIQLMEEFAQSSDYAKPLFRQWRYYAIPSVWARHSEKTGYSFYALYYLLLLESVNENNPNHPKDSLQQSLSSAPTTVAKSLAGITMLYFIVNEWMKAAQDLVDGRVLRGSMVLGVSTAVSSTIGYLLFGAAATLFLSSPFAIFSASLLLMSTLLVTPLLTTWVINAVSTQYTLSQNEILTLQREGYDEEHIRDIQHHMQRLHAERRALGYTHFWSKQHDYARYLERECSSFKASQTVIFFAPPTTSESPTNRPTHDNIVHGVTEGYRAPPSLPIING